MYGKFFSSTFTGSMIGAGPTVFAVWGYIIANAFKSHVELNPQLLSAIIGSDVNDIEAAIKYLEAPDLRSRSKDMDGRRIVKVGQFLYSVTNFQQYHNMRNEEDRREYNRVKQAEHRARQKTKQQGSPESGVSNDVSLTNKQRQPNQIHITDTDTDTENTVIQGSTTVLTPTANSEIQKPLAQPQQPPSGSRPTCQPDQQTAGFFDAIHPEQPAPKRKAGRPKSDRPKEPKSNGNHFPALNPTTLKHDDSLPKVNAWAVWIDILRDRGYPTPLPDPKDLNASKPLNSVPTRLELEWIYCDYIQDEDDEWLTNVCPKAGARSLQLLTSIRVAKYRLSISKCTDGIPPTYTYGTFKKQAGITVPADDDRDPADVLLEQLGAKDEEPAARITPKVTPEPSPNRPFEPQYHA